VPLIAPSILAADFGRLADEVRAVERAGADWIHVDVMDGHFVPNLTLGPDVVAAIDRATDLPLDVHLMIDNPHRYVDAFAASGADYLTIHQEAVADLEEIFAQIEKAGCKPGVAINPATPVETVSPFIDRAALILVMSVNPGFGAQSFMPVALPKLRTLAELRERDGSDCLLEVDGGIKPANAAQVIETGVDVVVAGSAIFGSDDYRRAIAALRAPE
jgi:ribulose-phosphate 3-epimerase